MAPRWPTPDEVKSAGCTICNLALRKNYNQSLNPRVSIAYEPLTQQELMYPEKKPSTPNDGPSVPIEDRVAWNPGPYSGPAW
jgi:hypothetical protein